MAEVIRVGKVRLLLDTQVWLWWFQSPDRLPTGVIRVSTLPDIHPDPFDRLIVPQAICENLLLVTANRLLSNYPISVLKAW